MRKSRDKRDRLTFDATGLRDKLEAAATEPGQSLASIVRMLVVEALDRKEKSMEKAN
ncbi:MAG: hypothetical protein HC786_22030 [Richelia sp. CSU_2_1]|nr:hypothetical protein [Richelia sp. CSU_2_1]